MEYTIGQKVLCVNVKTWHFIVSVIEDITPSGVIKLKCGLRFNGEDGFPFGYKSYTKRYIIQYGEDLYYAWRLLSVENELTDTLYNLKMSAYDKEQEYRKQLSKK